MEVTIFPANLNHGALKEEQAGGKRQLHERSRNCYASDFIRLIDYMEVETLVSLVIETSEISFWIY